MKSVSKQPDGLISVLLNKEAEYGDRTDAAADLAAYDDLKVEDALVRVATDSSEDEELLDHSGEALATIWCRKGHVNLDTLTKMARSAREVAEALIREKSPDLLKK